MDTEERLNQIMAAAKERMAAVPDNPQVIFAEIFFMTNDEVEERHFLCNILSKQQGSAEDARKRISQKRIKYSQNMLDKKREANCG